MQVHAQEKVEGREGKGGSRRGRDLWDDAIGALCKLRSMCSKGKGILSKPNE